MSHYKKERKNVLFGEILQPQRFAKGHIMVGYNARSAADCYLSA